MDNKASVLGNAIKYLENLQERVRVLEEQVVDRRSDRVVEDEGSGDEQTSSSDGGRLPEVDARVCNNSILLKIQCENRRGFLVKILGEVERLNLLVINASVAPFGSFALDVTIIAETENEFSLQVQDMVAALRSALQSTT